MPQIARMPTGLFMYLICVVFVRCNANIKQSFHNMLDDELSCKKKKILFFLTVLNCDCGSKIGARAWKADLNCQRENTVHSD